MKLRRTIAILFIILANISILAHAVIPHYHHDGIVCFDSEQTNCHTCETTIGAAECCSDDVAKHHAHLEDCNLPQVIERSGNAVDDLMTIDYPNSELLVCICTLHCYNLLALEDVNVHKNKRYSTYLNNYLSPYLGSNIGLRAPPADIIL